MKIKGCHALITGASAGLGREFALQLAPHAAALVLVARREERLLEVQRELQTSHPGLPVRIRKTDLSDAAQLEELCAFIQEENIAVNLLVNNAGLGDVGPFASSDANRLEQMILVNMLALTKLTRCFVPAMIAQGRGAILNVSSSAGFLPIGNMGVYAATKAYVTSFSEALRAELRGTGVSVTALCPGPVHTEFSQVAHRAEEGEATLGPEISFVAPQEVVRAALAAVEADRPLIIPGLLMKFGMVMVRSMPLAILRIAARFSTKQG